MAKLTGKQRTALENVLYHAKRADAIRQLENFLDPSEVEQIVYSECGGMEYGTLQERQAAAQKFK